MAKQKSGFIKTAAFGGYDRIEVDKRLEALYSQVFELKNELIESKLMLEKFKKGSEAEKAHEYALTVERGKLTELQVKNEMLSDKLKKAQEDNKLHEQEIANLREETEKLKTSLDNADTELKALRAGGDASVLGTVFIEAQKSKELLIITAKEEAEKLKSDTEKLAENIITDADNKAAMIIYEAEKRAAEITAEAITGSEQMKVASENMKAVMLQELGNIGQQIDLLKKAMEFFETESSRTITDAEDIINNTEAELKAGGVPVFTVPEEIKPDYPEQPQLKDVNFSFDDDSNDNSKKGNSELDRLQAMAERIGGETKKSVSLDDLAKQASAIEDSTKQDDVNTGKKSMSLADLAKQAAAIGDSDNADKPDKAPETDSSVTQGIDLAALAKQAEALGSDDEDTKSDNDSTKNNNIIPNTGMEPDELDELEALAKQAEALLKK